MPYKINKSRKLDKVNESEKEKAEQLSLQILIPQGLQIDVLTTASVIWPKELVDL